MPRLRSRLALKIVLPFGMLTLAIGAAGTLVATGQMSDRDQEAFNSQLVHDSYVAQSNLQSGDSERQALLRLLSSGAGLAASWNSPDTLQANLGRALALHPKAIVEAVGVGGREIVGLAGNGAADPTVTRGRDLTTWPGLNGILAGTSDRTDIVVPGPRPAVFAVQPVRGTKNNMLGAILVGDFLDLRAAEIKAAVHEDITFYDMRGQPLATTLELGQDRVSAFALDQATRAEISPTSVIQLSRMAPEPATELLAPWSTRTDDLGYVGVLASSTGLLANLNNLRLTMAILFLTGVLLTLLIGLIIARVITRPLRTLVEATRLVSAGDLDHRAPRSTGDEIGELTESFNQMTQSLKEKSISLKETMAQLQDTYLMTIEALAAAVEARDPYTHGHTRRVGQYAVLMAQELGVEEDDIAAIRRASVLHDIGKIGVEDQVLRKQARLDPDQELSMQRHPVIGVDMLKGIDFLEPVLPLVRHHHERWDGNGYPDQLRADEIPLGARILAVADAFDAMTSDRPYRPARTFEYAKSEILKGSGSHFDPEVVTAFIKCQSAIEDILREASESSNHEHPDASDLGAWRLHVIGR
jgi:putative nucleotidyltransferase with HDIG domain